jgi:hypothetical protein
MTAALERLVAAGIQILPAHSIENYFIFERDGFVALVERRENGFGRIGTPGLLTENGPAPLVWRRGSAYFVAKGLAKEASAEQVEAIRRFGEDLISALT